MDRSEALRNLARDRPTVAAGQKVTIDHFAPSDALAVARLFYAVYGDGYPIDTVYMPQRLIEENHAGSIRSVVARTPCGDVVAHVAVYRSSPPNARLYELGLALTLPAYRSGTAFCRASQLATKLQGNSGIDGFFGEAVCNHVASQKLITHVGGKETALEPALMPANAYEKEASASGRVGCLVSSRVVRDDHRPLFVPEPYRDELDCLMDGLGLDRELHGAGTDRPDGNAKIDVARFDSAGVARCTLDQPGHDLGVQMAEIENELRQAGYALIQFYVDLGQADCGALVEQLRERGFSLGGLLPIWFGSDGLLMQKHFVDPEFDALKLHSERARTLRDLVRRDRERCA